MLDPVEPSRKSAALYLGALRKLAEAQPQAQEGQGQPQQYLAADPDSVVSVGCQLIGMLRKVKDGMDTYRSTVRLGKEDFVSTPHLSHKLEHEAFETILKRLEELRPGSITIPDMGPCPPAKSQEDAWKYLASYMSQAVELARNFRDALGDDALRYRVEEMMPEMQSFVDDVSSHLRHGNGNKTASLRKEALSPLRMSQMIRRGAKQRGLPITDSAWKRVGDAASAYGKHPASTSNVRRLMSKADARAALREAIGDIKRGPAPSGKRRGLTEKGRNRLRSLLIPSATGLAGSSIAMGAAHQSQEERLKKVRKQLRREKMAAMSPRTESRLERVSSTAYPIAATGAGASAGSVLARRPAKGALLGALLGGSVGALASSGAHYDYKDREEEIRELERRRKR